MEIFNATPVQRLIQEMLDSLTQFSESAQRLGVTGRAQLSVAVSRSTLHAQAAEEKSIASSELSETSRSSTIHESQDWSESVTEASKELVIDNTDSAVKKPKSYDLDPVRLILQEALMREERIKADTAWMNQFKEQLDRISDGAEHFTLDGKEVLTYRRNGNLNTKRLESEHPDVVERYTRILAKLQFDKEAFAQEEPELFDMYKAKVFRVSPRARIR